MGTEERPGVRDSRSFLFQFEKVRFHFGDLTGSYSNAGHVFIFPELKSYKF